MAMTHSKPRFNHTTEDLGNIVELGHINVQVPDQGVATAFYVGGLSLTRDPYLMTETDNMWINVGKSQFHLPTLEPQALRGVIGLVVPDLDMLRAQLERVTPKLAGTRFAVRDLGNAVEVTCPYNNRMRLHSPDPESFGPIKLGIAYITFEVNRGAADGIARFYREVIEVPATITDAASGRTAHVPVGYHQWFDFQEIPGGEAAYDGHHVQVYLANLSRPYQRLLERGLVTRESSRYQFNFTDIVDPDSGRLLFQLEHEVRSMTHPMFARPLVNRDPSRGNRTFVPGQESLGWALR